MKDKYIKAKEEYLKNELITATELAKKYKCSKSTMCRNLKKLGVVLRHPTTSKEKIENREKYIIDYNKGLKISEIANKYNVDSHTVINHLKNAKIYKSPKYLDYNFNTTYFKNIDDEHKAYWLGFIYADGSISTINRSHSLTIELNKVDLIHLKKFRNDIKSNHPITTRSNRNNMCAIRVSSAETITNLKEYGCIENKTENGYLTEKIFNMENDYKKAFLRGYLDGDGYIDKKRYRIIYTIKSETIAQQLQKMIKEICNITFKIRKEKSYYRLLIENKKDTLAFLNCIYKNATIFLNRKYEIYLTKQPSQAETPEKISAELSGELLTDLYESTDTIIC